MHTAVSRDEAVHRHRSVWTGTRTRYRVTARLGTAFPLSNVTSKGLVGGGKVGDGTPLVPLSVSVSGLLISVVDQISRMISRGRSRRFDQVAREENIAPRSTVSEAPVRGTGRESVRTGPRTQSRRGRLPRERFGRTASATVARQQRVGTVGIDSLPAVGVRFPPAAARAEIRDRSVRGVAPKATSRVIQAIHRPATPHRPRPLLGLGVALVWLVVPLAVAYRLYRGLVGGYQAGSASPAFEEPRLAYARGDLIDEEFEQRRARLRRET